LVAVASEANELAAQTLKYLALFAVSILQRAFRTLLLPQLHLCKYATGVNSCMLHVEQQQYVLHAHSNVVTVASLDTCSAAAA